MVQAVKGLKVTLIFSNIVKAATITLYQVKQIETEKKGFVHTKYFISNIVGKDNR